MVDLAEAIEAALLCARIRCRGAGGLGFERSMPALVRSVLLRVTRLDPYRLDPELDPPDAELTQAVDASRGERGAVVRLNRAR